MNTYEFNIKTSKKSEFINITRQIESLISKNEIKNGICVVFTPHTTAGITTNENADPDVVRDIIMELDKIVLENDGYLHFEGNSAAHIKSSMMGVSHTYIIENSKLKIGRWQGIYFTEFDGPRNRKVFVKIM